MSAAQVDTGTDAPEPDYGDWRLERVPQWGPDVQEEPQGFVGGGGGLPADDQEDIAAEELHEGPVGQWRGPVGRSPLVVDALSIGFDENAWSSAAKQAIAEVRMDAERFGKDSPSLPAASTMRILETLRDGEDEQGRRVTRHRLDPRAVREVARAVTTMVNRQDARTVFPVIEAAAEALSCVDGVGRAIDEARQELTAHAESNDAPRSRQAVIRLNNRIAASSRKLEHLVPGGHPIVTERGLLETGEPWLKALGAAKQASDIVPRRAKVLIVPNASAPSGGPSGPSSPERGPSL